MLYSRRLSEERFPSANYTLALFVHISHVFLIFVSSYSISALQCGRIFESWLLLEKAIPLQTTGKK